MSGGPGFSKWMLGLAVFFMLGLAACQTAEPLTSAPTGESFLVSPTWLATPTQSPTRTPTPLQPPTLEVTSDPALALVLPASSTPTPVFYEPAGCWQPPEDYTRVLINEYSLNARTYAMLQQAALLYGGEIDVAGKAIIRGSYSDNPLDSLGIYLSGGAVDISVTRSKTQLVLYTEIEPLIRALRTVGFAAWLRDADEMVPGSEAYIQAVAIGDAELSPAAQEQLTGPAGYLRGYDGLSVASGESGLDRHGGPLICRWMLEAGYADLRTPDAYPNSWPGLAGTPSPGCHDIPGRIP
jgi:hypothetical protein